MQHFWRTLLRGLVAVIPVAATLYLTVWLIASAEWLLGLTVKLIAPDEWYWPGMGLLLGIALLYGAGWLVDHWLLRRTLSTAENLLERIPVVNRILTAVKDLLSYFSGQRRREFNRVVSVELYPGGLSVLGLVTRDDLEDLPRGLRNSDRVAVYVPGSYQIGGFTVLVDRNRLQPVDMTVEDALRFAVTGAMSMNADAPRDRTTPETVP